MKLTEYKKDTGIRFVQGMGAGWNLGNSLDVYNMQGEDVSLTDYETYWGNPVTTKEMIEKIREAGFDTVRIPVSWGEHMDESGTVDPEWMNRVKEVVDYVIGCDMYAVLDTHHEIWLTTTGNLPQQEERIGSLWQQIAETFQEYNNRLLFEGINEPRARNTEYEWEGTPQDRNTVNTWNRVFVDAVRSTGGNNADRYLLISTYAGDVSEEAVTALEIPEDDYIIVTVHLYKPHGFAMDEKGKRVFETADSEELTVLFDRLKARFIDCHIPVIIGEFACVDKDNTQEREEWTKYCVQNMRDKKMGMIWWDDGGDGQNGYRYALFDRYGQEWIFPEIMEELTDLK